MYSPEWLLDFILYEIIVQVEHNDVDAFAHEAPDEPLVAALRQTSLDSGGAPGASVSNLAPEDGTHQPSTGTGSTSACPTSTAETTVAPG